MLPQKVYHGILVFQIIHEILATTLNIKITTNCVVHYVKEPTGHYANRPKDLLLTYPSNDSSITLSHTVHEINNFSFLPWNDTNSDDTYQDEADLNVSINVVKAIQNSGYGSSEEALFFIETSSLQEEDHVVNGFLNDLFYSEGPSFHAPIVFFTSTPSEVGSFCYFCPEKDKRIQKQHTQLFYSDLQMVSIIINSKGYGNSFYFFDIMRYATYSSGENCFLYYSPKRERTGIFGEHVNCNVPEAWEVSSMTQNLNISPTFNIDNIDVNREKWFVQVRFGEGIMLSLPNEYMQTRGVIQIVDHARLDALSCRELKTSRVINLSITSAFDKWSWGCLVMMIVLYGLTFQSIRMGFDILWTFFGQPLMCIKREFPLFILVFMVSLLSYIYQSVISSDSLQLTEYPEFFQLIKDGYKLSVPNVRPAVSVINSLRNSTIESMTKEIGVHPLSILSQDEYTSGNLDFFRNMSRLKHMVTILTHPHAITTIGKDMVAYMGDDLVCKVFRLSNHVELPHHFPFRFWSYLSQPFSKVMGHLFSEGFYTRLENLKDARTRNEYKDLRIVKSTTFSKPMPIALWSTIGVCLCIYITVSGCALIWWVFCWNWEKKSEIIGFLRQVKQKLHVKFTTSVTKVEDFKNLNDKQCK
ncbi:unnamed protein product [Orchesella dallaii]|uniref:Uncharacterized protein n=1 Tax=Orchesella dallaii TaxID=48710 RepID=A0ABP1R6N4_9HEXA